MKLKAVILYLFLQSCFVEVCAQYYDKLNGWKKYRHELIGGIGVANYLGELGGGSGNGRPFIMDIEMSQFKFSFNAGYRYNLSYRTSARLHFLKGKVSGSDQLTDNPQRRYRNLSFQSNIYELALMFEYWILRSKPGHVHHIKGAKGQRGLPVEVSAFAGLGGFYYNPKSDGVALRPLGTEGQGLSGQPPKYSPISMAIPFGFMSNYVITPRIKVGLEFNFRYTFTDYLDDASTVYYDNDVLRAERGDVAADLADRTDGSNPNWSRTGSPRGNPKNKDFYFTMMANATYSLKGKSSGNRRVGGKHSFMKKGKRVKF